MHCCWWGAAKMDTKLVMRQKVLMCVNPMAVVVLSPHCLETHLGKLNGLFASNLKTFLSLKAKKKAFAPRYPCMASNATYLSRRHSVNTVRISSSPGSRSGRLPRGGEPGSCSGTVSRCCDGRGTQLDPTIRRVAAVRISSSTSAGGLPSGGVPSNKRKRPT